jgi:hypothetical protein
MGDFNTEQQPALPPKVNPNQIQRERITNSLIALPRPPSRMGAPATRPRGSPSPAPAETLRRLSRNDSNASGDVKSADRPPSTTPPMIPISTSTSRSDFDAFRTPYGISRGPSPLTLGMSDVVPLAVAFQVMSTQSWNLKFLININLDNYLVLINKIKLLILNLFLHIFRRFVMFVFAV